ncbi:DUF3194 domain-containing protein [Thermococcus thioreducens]|uniref:DUF3194 domain-containing protein n=1 Tax=Thermococcus thioreducens TaxID=277988 RepID=A0A0Q2XNU7_9EURY|nr:DUF3194 domain-containing protein [Thermococcus thioreducens]ASJ12208.1 hypothetical protein A3L14_04600 [Thermococcus thioreducens]KQH82948.1 hypothetical protein AMR53_01595 [Thermococcus thioreducens]SEV94874.1 Protein of unknown function [Thermococcus thioreducens]
MDEGASGRRVIHIGLPELSEEQLIEVGEIAQETIIKHVFDALNRSDVKDIEVTLRINRGEILDLEIEVYLEVPVFVKVDVEKLIDEAVEKAYDAIERKLREIANEGKAQA